jgi:hypothetical protein
MGESKQEKLSIWFIKEVEHYCVKIFWSRRCRSLKDLTYSDGISGF